MGLRRGDGHRRSFCPGDPVGTGTGTLILADYHLDHAVVGCDVVRHLREHFHQRIPAVIITADRTDQCRRSLQRLDAPLLNKPVKPGKLRAVLSQLLGASA